MGDVAVLFKVYPEPGQEDSVRKGIAEQLKPSAMQMEEIAFGIKVIKVMFVHSDAEGSSDFEEKLKKVNGVREVEVAEESLI
jgi:translation elongation factor EF-1beta